MSVDIFSCKAFDTEFANDYLKKTFGMTKVECNILDRGSEFPKDIRIARTGSVMRGEWNHGYVARLTRSHDGGRYTAGARPPRTEDAAFIVAAIACGHLLVGAPTSVLVWLVAGVLTILGALTYAELAIRRPEAGGLYPYLRDAFGELPAFLFGWTELAIVRAAALGVAAARVMPLQVLAQKVTSIVIAVGRAQCDVHVEFLGLLIVEEHALVHVEFHQQHRAVDLVIERVGFTVTTDP